MRPPEVPLQGVIICKELVGLVIREAKVALLMLHVQVLVQLIEVVKPSRAAKLAKRMPLKAAIFAVSFRHVKHQLFLGVAREERDVIPLVDVAENAD